MGFLEYLKGAVKSNTVQANSLFAAIWLAVMNSDWVAQNPDLVALFAGFQALVNLILRFKTSKPLAER